MGGGTRTSAPRGAKGKKKRESKRKQGEETKIRGLNHKPESYGQEDSKVLP